MIEMTEHEAILLDMLFRAPKTNRNFDHENDIIDALLRTVRATALRDAAKGVRKQYGDDFNEVECWLFDRADTIETGKA